MPTLTYQQIVELLTTVRDERRTHANTATRVGEAMLALLAYIVNAPYLRKDQPDQTAYLLTLLAGAVIGEAGQIRLNPDGSIVCGSLRVNGSAIFDELVFNHQNVLEGDTYFTDRAIIDSVEWLDGNVAELHLRKMFEADQFTFQVGDIVKWSHNDLTNKGSFDTGFGRVESVSNDTMTVTLYDGEDCPGGHNYMPFASARMARHGHVSNPARQYSFYVSASTGAFVFLQGVDKPILEDSQQGSNLSAWFGLPQDSAMVRDLVSRGVISSTQPYLYSRGIIVQDLIKVDYLGNPQYQSRDCGTWSSTRQYLHGYDTAYQGYFTDHVWWMGCLWKAAVAKPTIGLEPRLNNADWVCVFGARNVTVDIVSSEGDWFLSGSTFTTTLTASVWHAEQEWTQAQIGIANIRWERIWDHGDGDASWNLQHGAGRDGLTLSVNSATDIPGEWTAGSSVAFKCIVTMPDGEVYNGGYSIIL
ncbi:MAG: hypothetical protein IJ155_00660 [Prevotella sp.]|nr:hypothetical protein [Prevotella sp.]